MEEDLIKLLEDLKKFKEKIGMKEIEEPTEIKTASFVNLKSSYNILDRLDDKSLDDAFNDEIRSYENALAKCLEAGATADDDFMRDFTTHYTSTVLGIMSNLLASEDFVKNKDNVDYTKNKIKECLKYMDRL
jgi:hypothetical protein